jgi:hypothetical protein
MALGDDVFYITQSLSLAEEGRWPPAPYHWNTRLGVILPTVVSMKMLGTRPLAVVLWPLLASTSSVLVCYLVVREIVGPRIARLAMIFQAAFPLEVIYSTHLFPDVIVALLSTLSLWCWIRALRTGHVRSFLGSGAFLAAGYLCRETVVMEVPIYLALWASLGCPRRARMVWTVVVPIAVIVMECGLYAATAGTAFYRWSGILAQQRDSNNLALIQASVSGGNFWTDPLLMIATNQEFGLYQVAAFVIGIFALWRWPPARPFAIWWLVGFLWTFYGTTLPTRWVTLQRDPRYAASLTVPSVSLLAYCLDSSPWRVRWPAILLFLTSGLFAAGLEQGQSILSPLRTLARSAYIHDASLEPFEYVGAHWVDGLSKPTDFACANDRGRGSVVGLLEGLDGTPIRNSGDLRYFVFSPQRRPDLSEKLRSEGWTVAEEIPGSPTASRALVAALINVLPSQRERAGRIAHPPGLIVMQNPRAVSRPRE